MKKVVSIFFCTIQCICIYSFGLIKFVNNKKCVPAYASSTSMEVIDSICMRNKEYDGVIVHFANNRVYVSIDIKELFCPSVEYWFDLQDVQLYVSEDVVITLFSDNRLDSVTYARCKDPYTPVFDVMYSVNKLYKGCTYKIDDIQNHWIHLYDIATDVVYNGIDDHIVYLTGWVKWDELYKVSMYPGLVKDYKTAISK